MKRHGPAALLAGIALAAAGCDGTGLPRDPDGTLAAVMARGSMTVTAADHPPWVAAAAGGPPVGAEVDLVAAFARDLGVGVRWRVLPALQALEALDQGEADLAIGGFRREDVTALGAGSPSLAYVDETLVIARWPRTPEPADLAGRPVFLPPDVIAADRLAEEGAVAVDDPDADLALLPDWRLAGSGRVGTGLSLGRADHVVAVPKGENAWLMRVERSLRRQAAAMPAALRAHAAP